MADETEKENTTEHGVEDILGDLPWSAESLDQVAAWLRTQNQTAWLATSTDREGTDVLSSMTI